MTPRLPSRNRSKPGRGGGTYRPRVIVKFRDHVGLPYDKSAAGEIDKLGLGSWRQLATVFGGITLSPLFTSVKPGEILGLVRRAIKNDPTYQPPDFLTYFAVKIPPGVDPEEVANALAGWHSVQFAYVEPPPVEPPAVYPMDDPMSPYQGYLDPAPDGINAEYAWLYPGGGGAGQALVDLERGWLFDHEDLAAHGITLISGLNHSYFWHGTNVLGVVAAVDNSIGCIGIAPEIASVRCVSQYAEDETYTVPDPILSAIAAMNFGDVLLLETQSVIAAPQRAPVELENGAFDVIRLATALGIVVVEAAGNGDYDLDLLSPGGQQILNRGSTHFRDSGAIMVSASSSTAPHEPSGYCYGSRIDCYAWGESVVTTDDPDSSGTLYTPYFSGTSSAAAIVAGAALAVQGLAEANLGYRFSPWQLREILRDPKNGTLSKNPDVDRIGVMPDLYKIIHSEVLNVGPDVYVRDFVGDVGDPHTGAVSASPDIILRTDVVADPQTDFGEGSGTESSSTLSSEAHAGQDNFVYVRVRNRGGTAAADVQATVYWSPPVTLLTPDLWTLVGSTVMQEVPEANVLTVSDAIPWLSAEIPSSGHYCFVCLVGNSRDPAPSPADFEDFDMFRRFIGAYNNVAWKNFNVVEAAAGQQTIALSFIAPGAPDLARRMRLEVVGLLPSGARAVLEMPSEFAQLLRTPTVSVKGVKGDRVCVPVNPRGHTRFREVIFPAKIRIPMRLLVKIPKRFRTHGYEIYVRQMFGEEEVGRVTWRLAAVKPRDKNHKNQDKNRG